MTAPHDKVQVFARLIDGRKADSVFVCEKGSGITCWLPRSQVAIEEGGFLLASQEFLLGSGPGQPLPGAYLRITLPRWLAEDRGLRTQVDARQGVLL